MDTHVWITYDRPFPVTILLTVRNNVVTDAPPIARWTIGKPANTVAAWYKKQRNYRSTYIPIR